MGAQLDRDLAEAHGADLAVVVGLEHDRAREAVAHHQDQHRECDGEQNARDDAGDEQVADRGLRQDAEQDEQQARRDEHAEDGAAGDDADGEARIVAVAQHLGHRDLGEDRGRGDRGAGDGREHGVGGDGRDAEAAAQASEQMKGDLVGVAPDVGDADQKPHQHKKRDDAEFVAAEAFRRGERQHLAGHLEIAAYQPDAAEGDERQRHADVDADIDQHQDGDDRDEADLDAVHPRYPWTGPSRRARCSWRPGCPSSTGARTARRRPRRRPG